MLGLFKAPPSCPCSSQRQWKMVLELIRESRAGGWGPVQQLKAEMGTEPWLARMVLLLYRGRNEPEQS